MLHLYSDKEISKADLVCVKENPWVAFCSIKVRRISQFTIDLRTIQFPKNCLIFLPVLLNMNFFPCSQILWQDRNHEYFFRQNAKPKKNIYSFRRFFFQKSAIHKKPANNRHMGILTVTRVNLGEKLRDKENVKAVLCTMQVNLASRRPWGSQNWILVVIFLSG